MKNWDEEDLILYFYGELDKSESEALKMALSQSEILEKKYLELTLLLEQKLNAPVAKPGENFQQNIMAAIHREAELSASNLSAKNKPSPGKQTKAALWTRYFPGFKLVAGSALGILLVVGVFFFGRWTVIPTDDVQVADIENSPVGTSSGFSEASVSRVLMSKLSDHLESGDRIFTLVSNGNGDLTNQIQERQELIEELIVFNRIYRRLAKQKGDGQLVDLLSQMELLLVELENNTTTNGANANKETLNQVKQRLENSDLLFKLKVTNKKFQKNLI